MIRVMLSKINCLNFEQCSPALTQDQSCYHTLHPKENRSWLYLTSKHYVIDEHNPKINPKKATEKEIKYGCMKILQKL